MEILIAAAEIQTGSGWTGPHLVGLRPVTRQVTYPIGAGSLKGRVGVRNVPALMVYWGGDIHNARLLSPSRVRVLRKYATRNLGEDMGDLWSQWVQEYPPRATLAASAGWLDPDGAFYACAEGEHTSLAARLLGAAGASVQRVAGEGETALLEAGWLAIRATGLVIGATPTVSQRATLETLARLETESESWKETLCGCIEEHTVSR
jgi:hypothetical protein